MSYKHRTLFFLMMVFSFFVLTLSSIHVHAAQIAADGNTQLQAAPPVAVEHMTINDVTGAIVIIDNDEPKVVIFVFKNGKIYPIPGMKCLNNEACATKLNELLDAKKVMVIGVGQDKQPDIQTKW